jgi:hypothetical protein
MPFVIKNKDESIGYYTGLGWDANEDNATRYATEELAENIIGRHNMAATVEEVADKETDHHSKKRKG